MMKSLILLLLVIYTATCERCGGSNYVSSKQICCDGVELYDLKPGHVCCDDDYVDAGLCNSSPPMVAKALPKCGGRTFNPRVKVCCGSFVHSRKSNYRCCRHRYTHRGIKCIITQKCGTKTYNPSNYICCNNKVFTKDGGATKCCFNNPYNPRTHDCRVSGVVSKKSSCRAMSSRYVCCSGKKYRRRVGYACCLNAYMRSSACNANMMMCGSKVYDSSSKVCCNGAVSPLKNGYTCCTNGYVRYNQCSRMSNTCGTKKFNPLSQVCCNGIPYNRNSNMRCCSKRYYDPLQAYCSKGIARLRKCRTSTISTTCCMGRPYRKRLGAKCCKRSYYNPMERYCLSGIARPLRTCAARKYNPFSHRCCVRNVYAYKKYHSCCSIRYYDTRSKKCVSGRVYPK